MPSQELINIIIRATDEASAAAQKVDNNLNKIRNSTSRLSNIPGFDTMKSKMSSVAQTLDTKFGGALTKARNKFTTLKNGISNVTSTIKGKFGGALDGVRSKLSALNNGSKNLAGGMSFLKGAVSMTAGMIGFELVNSLMETTRASLNARSSMQAFANRLNMSGAEVDKFQQSLDELQNVYKKVDMDVVGQQATDMAYRLGLPKTSLTELTETTAIFNDAMQRNGRSSEDAMMAMADAMDGQFVRLKEIGISQEDLMKNGWDGDINNKTGLLEAMNKSLKDQHYDDLAKSVDTLDDAWQVLSITLSNLLESIIVPLTPAIVGIVSAVTDVANFLKDAFAGMPDWAKVGLGIAGLAIGFGLLAGSLVTAEGAFIGFEALMPGFIASLYGAASGFMAISIAGAPLWAIVAAVAAIAFAVYEVGKAFGWWKDVGTMLEAISAGASRLWSAFINHPDVQAAISMISSALSTLWGWIVQAGQAVLDFFNISSEGNFDIVATVIQTIGALWDAFRAKIMLVIGVVTAVYNTINWVFTTIWSIVGPIIMQIVGLVNSLIGAFDRFRNGQLNLPQFIMTVLTLLANTYMNIFNYIGGLVVRFGSMLLQRGISAASRFVNGIVTRVSQLPGKVYSWLMSVVGKISSAIAHWASTASAKVQSVIKNITSPFSGVVSAISGALSGVANAIKAPFEQAWNLVKPIIDNIKNGIDMISNLSFGGEPAYGGETAIASNGQTFNIGTGEYIVDNDDSPIVIEDNVNLNIDLRNVPSNINTEQLINALTDKNVLSALTSNRDFQSLDAKVKQKINLKNVRARGR